MTILTLDDAASVDPVSTGAKAAWLADARQRGLPVLPGVVVTADVSEPYLEHGFELLQAHGSGRARIVLSSASFPDSLATELATATADYSIPMVVRSSSILEASGHWSGAFTSYLDIREGEIPKAVLGCYASVFTQHTVERFAAAGVEPSKARMAVLVQPALDPAFGGTARLTGDEAIITGVAGSPAPLVQGWDPGAQARVVGTTVRGDEAVALMGERLLLRVARLLEDARDALGANSCEWAVQGDDLWLLQVQRFADVETGRGIDIPEAFATDHMARLGRLIRRYPGPLAEELVLPWAVGDPDLADVEPPSAGLDPVDAIQDATEHAAVLTAEVWGLPKAQAASTARATLRELRGPDPEPALVRLAGLRPPDAERAAGVLSAVSAVRDHLASIGAVTFPELAWHIDAANARAFITGERTPTLKGRIGFDRWEPMNAAVVTATGESITGTSASGGIAYGRMCIVLDPGKAHHFRPRDVVVGVHPVPGLAPLLFDAAALITTGGGPAAHLFESAQALAIPALCATRIEDLIGSSLADAEGDWALAVDGTNGTVHATRF